MATSGSDPSGTRPEIHTVVIVPVGADLEPEEKLPREWDVERCSLRGVPIQIDPDAGTISISKSLNMEGQLRGLIWRGLQIAYPSIAESEALLVATELGRLLWADGWR